VITGFPFTAAGPAMLRISKAFAAAFGVFSVGDMPVDINWHVASDK